MVKLKTLPDSHLFLSDQTRSASAQLLPASACNLQLASCRNKSNKKKCETKSKFLQKLRNCLKWALWMRPLKMRKPDHSPTRQLRTIQIKFRTSPVFRSPLYIEFFRGLVSQLTSVCRCKEWKTTLPEFDSPAALFWRITCRGPVNSSSETDLATMGRLKFDGACNKNVVTKWILFCVSPNSGKQQSLIYGPMCSPETWGFPVVKLGSTKLPVMVCK